MKKQMLLLTAFFAAFMANASESFENNIENNLCNKLPSIQKLEELFSDENLITHLVATVLANKPIISEGYPIFTNIEDYELSKIEAVEKVDDFFNRDKKELRHLSLLQEITGFDEEILEKIQPYPRKKYQESKVFRVLVRADEEAKFNEYAQLGYATCTDKNPLSYCNNVLDFMIKQFYSGRRID